jgi:hypothetical protein
VRRILVVAVVLITALLAPAPAFAIDEIDTKRLRNAVTVSGILAHERIFQRIANQNGGTRASGTPGYDASAAWRPPATRSPSSGSASRSLPSWRPPS